jgi:hypothetical protein
MLPVSFRKLGPRTRHKIFPYDLFEWTTFSFSYCVVIKHTNE